jgi:hypothetical protein
MSGTAATRLKVDMRGMLRSSEYLVGMVCVDASPSVSVVERMRKQKGCEVVFVAKPGTHFAKVSAQTSLQRTLDLRLQFTP